MKQRIHLHQLQIGMVIEELEDAGPEGWAMSSPFTVSCAHDVERVMRSRAMSVVIRTQKAGTVSKPSRRSASVDPQQYRNQLLARYPPQQLAEATQVIDDSAPQIQQVLSQARLNGTVPIGAASHAVERIMSSALGNANALIALSRLRKRDEQTFLHSLSVSALMIGFGRHLHHNEATVRLLGLGGLLHDIGKMTMPVNILQSTGRLTADEMEIVRTHPREGHRMLSAMESTPSAVLDICLRHHEKFDGTGYPDRVAGNCIPYYARVAAICDVYDALTSLRPYKRAWSHAEAIELMRNSKGHFDDDLLEAFVGSFAPATSESRSATSANSSD